MGTIELWFNLTDLDCKNKGVCSYIKHCLEPSSLVNVQLLIEKTEKYTIANISSMTPIT